MTTAASQDSFGEFDEVLDRSELSAVKWEMEFDRLGRKDLLSFGTADMDFRSPAAIGAALERVARVGHFGYPYKSASYYEAIIGFYQRNFGWTVQREWISHSTGVYPSMRPLIDRLSSIGDEVIYQSPVHFQFRNIIAANGRIPVANPLKLNNGRYEMDFEHLSRCVTPRTRLLLLCNPHNPVGRAWSRGELARLAEFCTKHRIIVLTDELYCGLLHEGATYTPYASVSEGALMNSVTLTSASKMFNLTGLKHSQVIAANPLLMATYLEGFKQDASGYGGSMFGQAAAEVAYRDCDDWLKRLMHYIAGNLQFATSYFEQYLPEVKVHPMESTYFMWLDFTGLGLSDLEMRHLFEDKHGLVLNYGVDLGPGGEGHIRLNIATQRSILELGLKRISDALK
ncbi:Cystathionine beta-lyase PatB [Achromobacter xylosoxidans]|uniref:MalY/PatB family protein n=1 Tax=Alcaligenes xylosoxydans xylosoxydans TaxID=85698 RepID=UPI0012A8DFC8|nr:PatB family C-S lyase [Achromobacter xylosoxidans]CUR72860.1 Cystathionine beta-lyase PatB [Achromobacter xylosoxidans]